MIRRPEELLGRSIDEPEVRDYLATLGSFANSEQVEDVYLSFHSAGIALLIEPGSGIQTVFLYASGHEGYAGYTGPLPLGLHLDLTSEAIRARLGEPAFSAPARELKYLGRKGPMERYDLPSRSIHVEYAEASGNLLVVTLMTPGAVPRPDPVH